MDESITRGWNLSTYNCRGGIHKTTNEQIHNKRTNPHNKNFCGRIHKTTNGWIYMELMSGRWKRIEDTTVVYRLLRKPFANSRPTVGCLSVRNPSQSHCIILAVKKEKICLQRLLAGFFFCFTKSEHYQLIFIIGHWRLKTWWLLKELFFVTSETSFVKALVKFKRQQLPLKAHCAHKRHVTPEAFPAHLL